MISQDFKGKPRYRSKKSKKSQGTDQQEWDDLYLGFSLIFVICTYVLLVKSFLGQAMLANPRYRSNCKTKAQIKEINEIQSTDQQPPGDGDLYRGFH